ncbi:cytochrome-c peroxidase [Prosthecobacter vanneervenii]|uniref:Cytochrome c peroxidase n=1 Tax=Prosthecobacter vanneervenii TaxID=48466 RepID=A0A7W7Y8J3_9BACT|nr:cytochrome c peroxidase [Prosthecobacter vanneervenii]MBB5031559.1 cytochrome c peroxidase [Prosthecobacter vanneervenii]
MPKNEIGFFRDWLKRNSGKHIAKQSPVTNEQSLGATLYSDKNLSLLRNQSCASCHSLQPAKDHITHEPLGAAGFVDPANVELLTPVSKGSVPGRFGGLNAPASGYAAFSPAFQWDGTQGLFFGGQFWDGRAPDLKTQAGMPFLNPVEMAMPSQWAVVSRLKGNPYYRRAFATLYKLDLDSIPEREGAAASAQAPAGVAAVFAALTHAIAEFEKSRLFNRFTSKFDFYLAGRIELAPQEVRGLNLFTGKAKCAGCHVSNPTVATDGTPFPPLFTDFSYDNIGAPRNTRIPGNPEPNLGLGGRADVADITFGGEVGKHKVMSLRNIAVTAPYGHNGVFTTLEQIVHFYNTRDVLGRVASNQAAGFGTAGWPAPEVPANVNDVELGALGLTDQEEADVVSFLKTLTDDYPTWGKDPKIPAGTPSPFAATPFPPMP